MTRWEALDDRMRRLPPQAYDWEKLLRRYWNAGRLEECENLVAVAEAAILF